MIGVRPKHKKGPVAISRGISIRDPDEWHTTTFYDRVGLDVESVSVSASMEARDGEAQHVSIHFSLPDARELAKQLLEKTEKRDERRGEEMIEGFPDATPENINTFQKTLDDGRARAATPGMSEGMKRIEAERKRQIEVEGWTEYHDDKKHPGTFSRAAACYVRAGEGRSGRPARWPWSARWWKPKDRVRNLERAGALYLAEADKARRNAERVAKLLDEALSVSES